MRWTAVLAGACVPAPWAAQWTDALRAHPLLPRLARATAEPAENDAGPQAAQRWLWRQLGGSGEPVCAPYAYAVLSGTTTATPLWFCEPVHYAAGIDDISVLPLDAPLDTAESAALRDAAAPALDLCQAGLHVIQSQWFLQTGRTWRIDAAPLDQALGGSLRSHWPTGPDAAQWRRLLTDIQMRWHDHPVNLARAALGARSINGLWLHGGGTWQPLPGRPWSTVLSDDPTVLGWMQAADAACRPGDAALPAEPTLFFDRSLAHWRTRNDPAQWLDRWRALAGRIDAFQRHAFAQGATEVELLASGASRLHRLVLRKNDRLRFWQRQNPQELLLEERA